jgi:hypothetical protein
MPSMLDFAQQTPSGECAQYFITPPGRERVLYSGILRLQQGSHVVRLRGRLVLTWFPAPGLRFQGRAGAREQERIELGTATLEVPALVFSGPVIVSQQNGLRPAGMGYAGSINGGALAGERENVSRILFHVVNFHEYLGDPIRFENAFSRGRLTMCSHGWQLTIDRQPGDKLDQLQARGGYAITHVGVLRRTGDRAISYLAAVERVQGLQLLLAFCSGTWCGAIITIGMAVSTVWTQWGSWKLTPWKGRHSWFPKIIPPPMEDLYREFCKRWRTLLWRRTLVTVISWYVQANAYGDSLEARLVPAFVALERMAWAYVVEDQKLVAPTAFNGFNAAKRITHLLQALQIPSAIPPEHRALRRVAKRHQAKDGPDIIAKIRNRLVHPKRNEKTNKQALFEATSLVLEYIELATLAVLQYRGLYVRRITGVTFSEATVPVPWISTR